MHRTAALAVDRKYGPSPPPHPLPITLFDHFFRLTFATLAPNVVSLGLMWVTLGPYWLPLLAHGWLSLGSPLVNVGRAGSILASVFPVD